MAYGRRTRSDSIFEAFTLNPLPYPVLLLLAVMFLFLGTSWYLDYESLLESVEEQLGWLLFVTPIVLLIIVHLLSSIENPDGFFMSSSPWDRRRRTHRQPSEGSSPWGVAAMILLLLVLLQYQSSFLESWFGFGS